MLPYLSEQPSSSVPYHNLVINEGFSRTFSVDAVDRTTGNNINLTGCSVTFTAADLSSSTICFRLTDSTGDITLGGVDGVITVKIPSSVTLNLPFAQLAYDLVLTDQVLVSRSVVRGLLTISPVA